VKGKIVPETLVNQRKSSASDPDGIASMFEVEEIFPGDESAFPGDFETMQMRNKNVKVVPLMPPKRKALKCQCCGKARCTRRRNAVDNILEGITRDGQNGLIVIHRHTRLAQRLKRHKKSKVEAIRTSTTECRCCVRVLEAELACRDTSEFHLEPEDFKHLSTLCSKHQIMAYSELKTDPKEDQSRGAETTTRGTLKLCRLGCGAAFSLDLLGKHELVECPRKLWKCHQCSATLPARRKEHHLAHKCRARQVTCRDCGQGMKQNEMTAHELECPENQWSCGCGFHGLKRDRAIHELHLCPDPLKPCLHGCGMSARAKLRKVHEDSECMFRLLECDECKDKIQAFAYDSHREICSQRFVSCLECGEEGIKAADLTNHLRTSCLQQISLETSVQQEACPECHTLVQSDSLQQHLRDECQEKKQKVKCKHGCGASFSLPEEEEKLNVHCEQQCPMVPWKCRCGAQVLLFQRQAHLQQCRTFTQSWEHAVRQLTRVLGKEDLELRMGKLIKKRKIRKEIALCALAENQGDVKLAYKKLAHRAYYEELKQASEIESIQHYVSSKKRRAHGHGTRMAIPNPVMDFSGSSLSAKNEAQPVHQTAHLDRNAGSSSFNERDNSHSEESLASFCSNGCGASLGHASMEHRMEHENQLCPSKPWACQCGTKVPLSQRQAHLKGCLTYVREWERAVRLLIATLSKEDLEKRLKVLVTRRKTRKEVALCALAENMGDVKLAYKKLSHRAYYDEIKLVCEIESMKNIWKNHRGRKGASQNALASSAEDLQTRHSTTSRQDVISRIQDNPITIAEDDILVKASSSSRLPSSPPRVQLTPRSLSPSTAWMGRRTSDIFSSEVRSAASFNDTSDCSKQNEVSGAAAAVVNDDIIEHDIEEPVVL